MSHPDEETELIKFMRQDASVVCGNGDLLYGDNEDEHKEITNIAIFLVFVWPFGSFVLFSSLLAMCYKAMQTNTPTDLSRAAAFLHREYEVGWYWWEALELLRKIVLTGLVVLVPEERAFLRLVIATLICSCYAVGLAVATPFKRIEDDILAVVNHLRPSPILPPSPRPPNPPRPPLFSPFTPHTLPITHARLGRPPTLCCYSCSLVRAGRLCSTQSKRSSQRRKQSSFWAGQTMRPSSSP